MSRNPKVGASQQDRDSLFRVNDDSRLPPPPSAVPVSRKWGALETEDTKKNV